MDLLKKHLAVCVSKEDALKVIKFVELCQAGKAYDKPMVFHGKAATGKSTTTELIAEVVEVFDVYQPLDISPSFDWKKMNRIIRVFDQQTFEYCYTNGYSQGKVRTPSNIIFETFIYPHTEFETQIIEFKKKFDPTVGSLDVTKSSDEGKLIFLQKARKDSSDSETKTSHREDKLIDKFLDRCMERVTRKQSIKPEFVQEPTGDDIELDNEKNEQDHRLEDCQQLRQKTLYEDLEQQDSKELSTEEDRADQKKPFTLEQAEHMKIEFKLDQWRVVLNPYTFDSDVEDVFDQAVTFEDYAKANDIYELVRVVHCSTFSEVIEFVNKIAQLVTRRNHYPDLHIRDCKFLDIHLSSHEVKGLTQTDFQVAADIDKL